MSYRENERKKAAKVRGELFRDPGNGIFFNKKRDFVLQDPTLNLWAGIREDAINYFERNQISWWMGQDKNEPTGHLLSSQIACVNHLFFVRQRKDIASAILKKISNKIKEAVLVDDGFVEFEVIGKDNYLNEKTHTRGANCTSVDAVMVGKKDNESNVLILIEWKYTEEYREENKYIPQRYNIYDKLMDHFESPITIRDFEAFYYEPFYQLMRQTLLGWMMVNAREYQCDEYLHLHIIPKQNTELRDRVTSPKLSGKNMSEAWESVLKEPERYLVISPDEFLSPVATCKDTKSILSYLQERYWKDS
ncbi:hypothetical protein BuS5_03904 [Desulfosarcina sp. BuS5]|uniref:PGN_0703 family putative restriction endonuclease n=1 Tax=Desulfosarcina sp. BuS5 TaxID=933262 RepID=UPI000487B99C|nr:hypothetical protein [Desulfosarcina sp. BuS5]WDN90933.1 hypothetical protein BuS5_03904 [Desulfosarcina sp. BuS5]